MMGCAKIMFANIIKRSIFNLFSLKNITKEVTKKSCQGFLDLKNQFLIYFHQKHLKKALEPK